MREALAHSANAALRKGILAAATNRHVRGVVQRHGLRLGAARFVAGETLEQCLDVLAALNARGLHANTSLLGEDVTSADEARAVAREYGHVLGRIAERGLRANVAVKLTHLGLLIDEQLAYDNVASVVDRAGEVSCLVRIDMEQSAVVDATLRIYRRLRESGRDNVGTVLQAYLYRTPGDLEQLLPLQPNLRLVKGAYLEPAAVAYPRKPDVDAAYLQLIEQAFAGGGYVAVATHDEAAIEHALAVARGRGIGGDRFELQLLYGVRSQLQLDLARRGHTVRVATPYGPEWYPYLMRRMAERPANLLFVLRQAVQR